MEKFHELVIDQMTYGGVKYALNDKKESTDLLFDNFGESWLFGTMAKYCLRYKNLARERDILKIACYCYISWLKRGFWVKDEGIKDILDTNVEVKKREFDNFLKKVHLSVDKMEFPFYNIMDDQIVDYVFNLLIQLNKLRFNEITESGIINIYLLCQELWNRKYSLTEVHDTDTCQTK